MKQILPFGQLLLFCCICQTTNAQLWKQVKHQIRHTVDTHISTIPGKGTGTDKDAGTAAGPAETGRTQPAANPPQAVAPPEQASDITYQNYDFVPGDKILFQPDLKDEPDRELPARFTVHNGNAEIQTYEGEKFLHLGQGSHVTVSPLMDTDAYLPEQFTIELDMMYENPSGDFSFNIFSLELRKPGARNLSATPPHNFIIVSNASFEWGDVTASRNALPAPLAVSMKTPGVWHHFALYVRKNIGKGYIDGYRVAASNTMPTGFGYLDIKTDGTYGIKIAHVRIAAGGDDHYQKIVTSGKFISHGILFDVNRAVIRPESMGSLNEVAKMMKDHGDLKLEIDGHTDADGDAAANLKLSRERAEAVRAKLVAMGIEASRLSTRGFGETKPISANDSAEGRANNRRVEFVRVPAS